MTARQQVLLEIERLKRLAAASHLPVPAAELSPADVEQVTRDIGIPLDCGLTDLWLAGETFVVVTAVPRVTRSYSHPPSIARRDWHGQEQDVTSQYVRRPPRPVTVRTPGTSERGAVSFASDGSGDEMDLLVRDGRRGRAVQFVWHDHETGKDTVVADGLAALLQTSNDLVERDPTFAFFHGDETGKIFRFPGTNELIRQLDAGLSPDARRGTGNLVGDALSRRRDDLFRVLVERGADKADALAQACMQLRLDLAEWLLAAGADPAARSLDGQTILAASALAGRPRTVALLMRFGARTRLPPADFDRLVAEVRDSYKLADREKRDVLQALGQ